MGNILISFLNKISFYNDKYYSTEAIGIGVVHGKV